jgi:exonuclease III
MSQNIRGVNSKEKWNSLKNKTMETGCDIVCVQETKRELFEETYIRKFCTRLINFTTPHPMARLEGL